MYIDKENNSVFLIQKLNNIKQKLNSDPINLNDLKRDFELFEKFKQEENYDYLEDLLDPINRKGVKVPSKVPVATCSFQLKNNFNVETNQSGLAIFFINPFFLFNKEMTGLPFSNVLVRANGTTSVNNYYVGSYLSTTGVLSRGSTLTGDTSNTNKFIFSPLNAGQGIPPVYGSYRLVSACLEAKYNGSFEEARGTMGGAVILDKVKTIGGKVQDNSGRPYDPSAAEISRYPQIESLDLPLLANIRNNFYSKEVQCLEGIRLLYFPVDNSFEEFKPLFDIKNLNMYKTKDNGFLGYDEAAEQRGFNFIVYVYRGPIQAPVLNITIYFNFECVPNAKFLNYLPMTINAWRLPKWKISELAKVMGKHAITAIKKKSAIDYFIA